MAEPSVEKNGPIHDKSCETWGCSHCAVCGIVTLYGSRCFAHDATKPPESDEHARLTSREKGDLQLLSGDALVDYVERILTARAVGD